MTAPKTIIGKDIINRSQITSIKPKKNIVNIPNKTISIPPIICHLNAMQTKTNNIIQGRALGIFLKTPLFSAPDINEKTSQNMATINNKYLAKCAIFCLFIFLPPPPAGGWWINYYFCIAFCFKFFGIFSMAYLSAVLGITALFLTT